LRRAGSSPSSIWRVFVTPAGFHFSWNRYNRTGLNRTPPFEATTDAVVAPVKEADFVST